MPYIAAGQRRLESLEDPQYPEQYYNQDNRHNEANYSANASLHPLTSPLTT